MKIIIIETVIDGSIIGGGNLYLPGLMKGLVQNGNDVHLVVKGTPNEKALGFINQSGAIVHIKPWGKKGLVKDMALRLAQWVNEQKPDIYFNSGSYDIGWLALPYINAAIATVAIAHSNADNFYFPVKHYKDFIGTAIGVSEEICSKFNLVSQVPVERIRWIPYGIQPAISLEERSEDPVLRIVFAGRLEEYQKRISDIKKIIKKLATVAIQFQFKIIGDGSEYQSLREQLSAEIEKGCVEMPGWVPGDKVLAAFRNSDVFILTSDSEGFSISLIEGMANGCCPVVTDIPSGSTQLIKNNENGFLIPVGDLDAFVEKLHYLHTHKEELLRMRKAAWEVGKNYSVERMVETYSDCFVKGIEQAKKYPRKTHSDFPVMESCQSKYPDWLRRIKLFLLNESGFAKKN